MDEAKEYLDDMTALEAQLPVPNVNLEEIVRDYVSSKYENDRLARANRLIEGCRRRVEILADNSLISDFNSPLREIESILA